MKLEATKAFYYQLALASQNFENEGERTFIMTAPPPQSGGSAVHLAAPVKRATESFKATKNCSYM